MVPVLDESLKVAPLATVIRIVVRVLFTVIVLTEADGPELEVTYPEIITSSPTPGRLPACELNPELVHQFPTRVFQSWFAPALKYKVAACALVADNAKTEKAKREAMNIFFMEILYHNPPPAERVVVDKNTI